MNSTSSISKGVFIFKNGFKKTSNKSKKKKEKYINTNSYTSELWYKSYIKQWTSIEEEIKRLNSKTFSTVLSNLVHYVKNSYNSPVENIPSATLLMGINMPDHTTQFTALSNELTSKITPHVAVLHPENCLTLKTLIENMVSQFVNDYDEDEEVQTVKKSLCTIPLLKAWYSEYYSNISDRNLLVVILPEFESFKDTAIQDFIEIISNHIDHLPFVLIFGVSTSLTAIHKTMPYHVTSKLNIQVFNSQTSIDYLNSILDNIILSGKIPFHLGGKTFTLFCDIFLFYDFSVTGFIQNFKFSMLEHYRSSNAMSLCTSLDESYSIIDSFSDADLDKVRHLMSFRKYVESKDFNTRINLIENDNFFKEELKEELFNFNSYMFVFHNILKILFELIKDLPKYPLGRQFRELYSTSVSQNVTQTEEYKECLQLLTFVSKDELISKLDGMINILNDIVKNNDVGKLRNTLATLKEYSRDISNASFEYQTENVSRSPITSNVRSQLKEKLFEMSKQGKTKNNYEKIREKFLSDITNIFSNHLMIPTTKPFHEIYFFNDASLVKNHVIGSHRASIHMALDNPEYYLQCQCCPLPNETAILPTLPDISVAYKLHLECGKMINMYDWLQAFAAIVNPTQNGEDEQCVDELLQARFTRAVAELEFLGFIKSSKRKTDHVTRLTWGGC